jgi:hypothetical protein
MSFVSFADHAMYLAHSVGNQQAVMQLLWRYHRPVDVNALSQFRDRLASGRLARLIKPPIVPFGRPLWTHAPWPSTDFEVSADPLAIEMFQSWCDAQVERPLDPVKGPGWNLTGQVFNDGSTAVSLVISHCIADGMATAIAVSEAVRGEPVHLDSAETSTPSFSASLFGELVQFIQDLPLTLSALAQLFRSAVNPKKATRASPSTTTEQDHTITLPSVSVRLPLAVWDEKATSLGVTRLTLMAAMTTEFAVALGRIRENAATLFIPVNQRSHPAELDANCVSIATLKVPVDEPLRNLQAFQNRLQSKIRQTRTAPDVLAALLPLIPYVPKRAFIKASRLAFSALTDLPVTCSHMGESPAEVRRIDGTVADFFCFRGMDRQLTLRTIEQRQGVASLISGSIQGDLLLNFVAYEPNVVTQHVHLRSMVQQLLVRHGINGDFFDD